VLISTLLSLRKTALRAESVLAQVEREIRPMASELETLTGDLQKLSRNANDNLQRIGGIVDRVEDISVQAARVVGAVGGLTRIGQYAGMAAGVKRGVEVFLHRLKERHH
jgi:ABC-type transporter Mla subunit MlaD